MTASRLLATDEFAGAERRARPGLPRARSPGRRRGHAPARDQPDRSRPAPRRRGPLDGQPDDVGRARSRSTGTSGSRWCPRAALAGSDVEGYQVVLPAGGHATSDTTPRQRIAFGVTAADAEPYVPDRRVGRRADASARQRVDRGGPGGDRAVLRPAVAGAGRPRRRARADLAPTGRRLGPRRPPGRPRAGRRHRGVPGCCSSGSRPRRCRPGSGWSRGRSRWSRGRTTAAWALSPADDAALRAGYAAREVPDRFLAHAAARLDGLDDSAERVGTVDPTAAVEDTLPNRPSRWLYRLRAVDAAGRPSAAAQVLGVVVHVPSPSRAVAPTLRELARRRRDRHRPAGLHGRRGRPVRLPHRGRLVRHRHRVVGHDPQPDDLAPDRAPRGARRERQAVTAVAAVRGAGDDATASAAVPADGLVLHAWALSVTLRRRAVPAGRTAARSGEGGLMLVSPVADATALKPGRTPPSSDLPTRLRLLAPPSGPGARALPRSGVRSSPRCWDRGCRRRSATPVPAGGGTPRTAAARCTGCGDARPTCSCTAPCAPGSPWATRSSRCASRTPSWPVATPASRTG